MYIGSRWFVVEVEYYCMVAHYILGYKWVGLDDECLRGKDWLGEEDLVDKMGQLSSPLLSSFFHCRWNQTI